MPQSLLIFIFGFICGMAAMVLIRNLDSTNKRKNERKKQRSTFTILNETPPPLDQIILPNFSGKKQETPSKSVRKSAGKVIYLDSYEKKDR